MQSEPNDARARRRQQRLTDAEENQKDLDVLRCHWAKTTDHRCQILGTRGFSLLDEQGILREAWYCEPHRERSEGLHSDVLEDYSVFLTWLGEVNHANPHTQWNDLPELIWDRLHGRAPSAGIAVNFNQQGIPPSTSKRVTRAEKIEIAAKLTPILP